MIYVYTYIWVYCTLVRNEIDMFSEFNYSHTIHTMFGLRIRKSVNGRKKM